MNMKTTKYYILLIILLFACNNKVITKKTNKIKNKKEQLVLLTKKQTDALNLKIDTLKLIDMKFYVKANGTLEVPPQNEASVTSTIGAKIISIKVIEGQKVNKGQVLALLQHPNIIKIQTEYLKVFNSLKVLKNKYERHKKLLKNEAISIEDFQNIEADFNTTKAIKKGLKNQLKLLNIEIKNLENYNLVDYINLKSPINGYIQKVKIKLGQFVEEKKELFEIVNNHHVHADFMVFEKDVFKLKNGQEIIFTLQTDLKNEYVAKIISVGKVFEQNPKAIHVHAEIKNKQENLIPGMYITGKIITDNVLSKCLPQSAIVNNGDKYFVFVAKQKEEKWEFKPIEVYVENKYNNWFSLRFSNVIDKKSKFVYNKAYYLFAEMEKSENEHAH